MTVVKEEVCSQSSHCTAVSRVVEGRGGCGQTPPLLFPQEGSCEALQEVQGRLGGIISVGSGAQEVLAPDLSG